MAAAHNRAEYTACVPLAHCSHVNRLMRCFPRARNSAVCACEPVTFSIAFEMAVIFLGGAPVFRVMKSWLRKGVMPVDDVRILIVWILVSIVISLFLAFFFLKKGINKLEASSS